MSKQSRRWLRVAKFVAYPLFYMLCLAFFGYLSFPWDQLKDRVISEFNKSQAKQTRRPGEKPMRLEIDELDSYWFSGVEITGARLIIPPKPKRKSAAGLGSFGATDAKEEAPPKDSVVRVDTLTARARLLSLLSGDVVIDFNAEAFGGTIEGTVPLGLTEEDVEIEFSGLRLVDIEPLQAALQGVPLQGLADGTLKLTPKEGKFAKADGEMNIAINGVKLGSQRKNDEGVMEDVVEIQGIAIPSVVLGTLNLQATAKDGLLTLADLSAKSPDFELLGEGNIKLNEAWDRSRPEMFLQFKFTDAYRTKSPAATSLLGKPGDKSPLIELGSPDIKRAKTPEGFYRFHIHGTIGDLDFDPAGSNAPTGPRTTRRPTPGGVSTAPRTRRRAPAKLGAASPKPTPRPRPVMRPQPDGSDPPTPDPPGEDPPGEDPPEEPGDDTPDETPSADDADGTPAPGGTGGGEGG